MSVYNRLVDLYGGLFEQNGNDARSLGHNDQATQYERFRLLSRLFERETEPFTVHEIGCALGHFGEYLQDRFPQAIYSGSDINPRFVEVCQRRFPDGLFFLRNVLEEPPTERYDYVVQCGIFNMPGDVPDKAWQIFTYGLLEAMYAMCAKGIGSTFLTIYYDPGYNRPDLFYQDERQLLDFAVDKLSRHCEIDRVTPLYDYALRVYRPEFIRTQFPDSAFDKYFKFSGPNFL